MSLTLTRALYFRNASSHLIKLSCPVCVKYCSNNPPSQKPGKYSREAVRQNVKGYVFTRYIDHVQNYDKVLEKNFPSAMRVYRVFLEGVKDFYKDMKRYLKITRILSGSPRGLDALTRSELELYDQMPRDMVKVAPALFLSTLPVVGYAIFPIAYMYPRTFLTSHFWSLQQRSEFQQLNLKDRLINNRKVFRALQAKLGTIKTDPFYRKWKHILGLLGSGLHPTADEILYVKELFTKPPYDFKHLTQKHVKYLCHLHGLRSGLFKRIRLTERAEVVHYMDLAIIREGGVHNMHPDALRHACYIRGLNPTNLTNENLIEWLRNWVNISAEVNEDHLSLFLHLPILIGYNHPNNWRLLHEGET